MRLFLDNKVPETVPDGWDALLPLLALRDEGRLPEIQFLLQLEIGKEEAKEELGTGVGRSVVDSLVETMLRVTRHYPKIKKAAHWKWLIGRKVLKGVVKDLIPK